MTYPDEAFTTGPVSPTLSDQDFFDNTVELCPYCNRVVVPKGKSLCGACEKELHEEAIRIASMTDEEFEQEQAARSEEMIDFQNNQERLFANWSRGREE